MTLAEGISTAETVMGRPLSADEIAIVAQLVERGKSTPDVVMLFESFERPPRVDDEGLAVYRYEPADEASARRI